MSQTIVQKIAQAHLAGGSAARPVRTGDFVTLRPRHVMTHDNTAAVMKKYRALGVSRIHDPGQPVFALDHDIQNTSSANLAKYESIEAFARAEGVDFHPAGSGIGHQIMVENGYVLPGTLVVASDSHSNMYGALGALGTPVVRTDAAAIWATGRFWWQVPRTVQVLLEGSLPAGVTGKDVIVTLCGLYNSGEVLNAAVEFGGPGVASLGMSERFTIANMTTEWGALVGWFPCDETTLSYLEERRVRLASRGVDRPRDEELRSLAQVPPLPDPEAHYEARIHLDLNRLTPHVAGPDTVQTMTSVAEMEERRVPIQKAYIVSCVNSRVDDLDSAARVLSGKRVAEGVDLYVAAASGEVQEQAEAGGAWATLLEAGAKPLPPGCGPCIGLGTGLLEPGEVGISATNRNFKGRMGSREAQCYLASPEVVAASAVRGYISGPNASSRGTPPYSFQELEGPTLELDLSTDIIPDFPRGLTGRAAFLPQDNLNTDGIYGKDYTYREDMSVEDMAGVVMENYDPSFAGRAREGDIIIGGFNFGTGSSREQAVTALAAKGIPLVIAASFSQTYLRNAFNNGFLCIECPELVKHLREEQASAVTAGEKTIIPEGVLEIDFASSEIRWSGVQFRFPSLSRVPQELVVAGGVENLVRREAAADGEENRK